MKNGNILLQLQLGNVFAEVTKKSSKGPLAVQATFYRLFGDPESPRQARSFSRSELDDLDACLEEVRSWYDAQHFDDSVPQEGEASCDVVAVDALEKAA